jgi:hypothetical protein
MGFDATLKMDTVSPSETLASYHNPILSHNAEDLDLNIGLCSVWCLVLYTVKPLYYRPVYNTDFIQCQIIIATWPWPFGSTQLWHR